MGEPVFLHGVSDADLWVIAALVPLFASVSGRERERLLTPDRLHHGWSSVLFSSHLPDPLENASTPLIQTTITPHADNDT